MSRSKKPTPIESHIARSASSAVLADVAGVSISELASVCRIQIFAIYDKQAQAFIPPFYAPTVGMAQRQFSDAVQNEQGEFFRHPDDYDLYHIGAFNDSLGDVVSFPAHERRVISRARDFIKPVA